MSDVGGSDVILSGDYSILFSNTDILVLCILCSRPKIKVWLSGSLDAADIHGINPACYRAGGR